jgi:hypothetical protein
MDQFTNHPLYGKHNIDSAMNSLWDFYKSRFISLFLISLGMSLVVQFASSFIDLKDLQSTTDPAEMLAKVKGMIVPILGVSLLNLFFTTILQYYILYNPIDKSNNIFVSLVKSMRYFLPFLIIMILLAFFGAIAMFLGLFVLIVGAFFALLYVLTIYLIILPVLMSEGPSIGNAITRTLTLVHRNFWSNIGWVAVFFIILIVVSLVLSGIILLPFAGSFFRTLINPEEASKMLDMATSPLFIAVSSLAGAVTMPLMPIFALILYFNGLAGERASERASEKGSESNNNPGNSTNPDDNRVRVEDLYAKPYSDDHPDNPDTKKN